MKNYKVSSEHVTNVLCIIAVSPEDAVHQFMLRVSEAYEAWDDEWEVNVEVPGGETLKFDVSFEFSLDTRIENA